MLIWNEGMSSKSLGRTNLQGTDVLYTSRPSPPESLQAVSMVLLTWKEPEQRCLNGLVPHPLRSLHSPLFPVTPLFFLQVVTEGSSRLLFVVFQRTTVAPPLRSGHLL